VPTAPSIDFTVAHSYPPLTDREGDAIRAAGFSVDKISPRGTTTVDPGAAGDEVIMRGVGDFDGDGHSDLLVDLYKGGAANATFVVPGTVAPGRHAVASVGIPIPTPGAGSPYRGVFPAAIGDQNHDGADDIGFGPLMYSGRALMTAPAVLPAPFRVLPAMYLGLLNVDKSRPPSLVVPDPETTSLAVLDGKSDRLFLDSPRADLTAAIRVGARVSGWLVDGHHIVELQASTRSGDTQWRWDLDAPCGN
jgi:hypothetical protein